MDMPIVKNLMETLPQFYLLFNAICWITGVSLLFLAMSQVYEVSGGRSQKTLNVPITTFFVAVAFLFLPTTFGAMSATFFGGNTNILAYSQPNNSKNIGELILRIVEFIGALGVRKGLLTAKAVGDGNAREGGVGRALTFMSGGILALNITTFGPLLAEFVGLDMSWITT